MEDLKLLGMSGSLRAASTNTKLLREAAIRFGPAQFQEADLNLPLYDGDLEAGGIPEAVQKLADQIAGADAVIVSTPEYNKGISGVLKNALDWVSRTEGNPWQGKPVAVMSAAAGRAGGERAQQMLRWCLNPFRPYVLAGPELMIAQTGQQWDAEGRLTNERSAKALDGLMQDLRAEALRLRG